MGFCIFCSLAAAVFSSLFVYSICCACLWQLRRVCGSLRGAMLPSAPLTPPPGGASAPAAPAASAAGGAAWSAADHAAALRQRAAHEAARAQGAAAEVREGLVPRQGRVGPAACPALAARTRLRLLEGRSWRQRSSQTSQLEAAARPAALRARCGGLAGGAGRAGLCGGVGRARRQARGAAAKCGAAASSCPSSFELRASSFELRAGPVEVLFAASQVSGLGSQGQ